MAKLRLFHLTKKQVPFCMATENMELVPKYFLKHSHMGTARIEQGKETDEECKKQGVSIK